MGRGPTGFFALPDVEFRKLLWELWMKKKRRGVAPSAILGIDYPWVADDLDDAVCRWGEYVEAECREAYEAVMERWRAMVRRRQEAHARGGARGRVRYPPPPVAAAEDAAESRWHELVRRVRRRRMPGRLKKVPGQLLPQPTAILTWEQPLHGDERDLEWTDEARIVSEEKIR